MTATSPGDVTPEQTLAREEAGRLRAGIAAILGGLLLFAGAALSAAITADAPRVYVIEALREAAGQDIGRTALLGERIEFLSDHSAGLIGAAALTALGWIATGLALSYLLAAARARRTDTPRFANGLLVAGAGGLALSVLVTYVALAVAANDFVTSSDQTSELARDVLQGPVLLGGQLLRTLATLAIALGIVFTALNAMRAGLLTRFMGILGIITGVLLIFPIGVGLPVVQTFWLVTLGLLILGRIPGGRPPAWQAGEAVPWPSQQELREQRERARGGDDVPQNAAEPQLPRTEAPSPATSSKKKRKRRA